MAFGTRDLKYLGTWTLWRNLVFSTSWNSDTQGQEVGTIMLEASKKWGPFCGCPRRKDPVVLGHIKCLPLNRNCRNIAKMIRAAPNLPYSNPPNPFKRARNPSERAPKFWSCLRPLQFSFPSDNVVLDFLFKANGKSVFFVRA